MFPLLRKFSHAVPFLRKTVLEKPSGEGQSPNAVKSKGNIMLTLQAYATLRAMTVDEIDQLALDAAKVEKQQKDKTKEHAGNFKPLGKVICIVGERLEKAREQKLVASNATLESTWFGITATKINGHALQCAVAFGTFVQTDLVPETKYDNAKTEWLKVAGTIANACGRATTHDAVLRTAEILKNPNVELAGLQLKAILREVKPAKVMDAEEADEQLAAIFAAHHLLTVLDKIVAEIPYIVDEDIAKQAYYSLETAIDGFAKNVDKEGNRRFGDDAINTWLAEKAKALNSAPKLVAPETVEAAKR